MIVFSAGMVSQCAPTDYIGAGASGAGTVENQASGAAHHVLTHGIGKHFGVEAAAGGSQLGKAAIFLELRTCIASLFACLDPVTHYEAFKLHELSRSNQMCR